MMSSAFIPFSLLSGVCGALASCFAKLAFTDSGDGSDSDSSSISVATWVLPICNARSLHSYCAFLVYILRTLCFVCTLLLNVVMLSSFLQGMESSGSVAGTALANAANFVTSSFVGYWLWEEQIDRVWLLGFGLVITGSYLLSTVQAVDSSFGDKTTTEENNEKEKMN